MTKATMQTYNKFKKVLTNVLNYAILPGIGVFIGSILVINYMAPNFKGIATWNNKWKIKEGRQVKLDIIENKNNKPFITLTVTNDSKNKHDDVKIQIKVSNNKLKPDHSPKPYYDPETLEQSVIKEKGCFTCDEFLEVFDKFQGGSSVEYTIYLQNFIEDRKDFKPSILSDSRNYSDNIEYKETYKDKESFIDCFSLVTSNQAYANDGGDNADPKYYIGGYDPIKISKGIINLLRGKKLLDFKNYNLLKDNLKVKIDNFIFGGIDLVKVNNDILLILEDKKIISHKETIEIFKEAERAGGLLVGGYNIIILEVRILDTLIEKNVITVEEGQDIVDQSKFLDVTTIH